MEGVHSLDVPISINALPPALDRLTLLRLQDIRFVVILDETLGKSIELVEVGVP